MDRERDASEGVKVARTATQAMSEPQSAPAPKPKRHVSQEARQRMSHAQRSRHLTARQERFVKHFAHLPNASAAARAAGYRDGPGIGVTACRTLKKANVKAALAKAEAEIAEQITPGRVQRRLHEISYASQAAGQYGPAVRSEELLGKSIGMWVDQSLHLSGVLNDSHVAALLEIARRRQQEPIDLTDDVIAQRKHDDDDG